MQLGIFAKTFRATDARGDARRGRGPRPDGNPIQHVVRGSADIAGSARRRLLRLDRPVDQASAA